MPTPSTASPKTKRQLKATGASKEQAVEAPKRRREKTAAVALAPESQQLFKGLTFYFVPNDLNNGARRMRVNKAVEYGAICSNDWANDDVTHIVADRHFEYKHILQYLKIDSISDHIAVVNEKYPGDCLHFHRLLDTAQPIYAVPGRATVQRAQPPPASEPEAAIDVSSSLQIKPVKGKRKADESTQKSKATPTAPPQDYDVNDILSRIIEETKRTADLPLDDDEEFESTSNIPVDAESNSDDERDSGSDHASKRRRLKVTKTEKSGDFQAAFQCMYKHDGQSKDQNPNQRTIDVLSEMQKYYELVGDHWRSLSYRKAIATLKKQTTKIVFAEEAHKLPFVGERLAKKIEEIVFTNHLKRLEYANLEPHDALLKLFMGIYGAGPVQARRWIAAGYKSLDDLLKKAPLTTNQRIGVEHYEDFNSRIPREEVQRHGDVVKRVAHEIDAELELEIMGSFRRGAADCGDIDIIITKKGATISELKPVLDELVSRLFAINFLQCTLATSHKDFNGSKWHGASMIESGARWRRIDFLLVPWKERGAALLYFTGNDIFNRSMRLLASKKGYRLNQRGLYKDVMRGVNRIKVTEGTLVEAESEERIFEILGVPYRPPEHRIC
ncbi:putative DNA polymerase POL4 [Kalaharituber pfeilii]|nr:putative DNA polymerase POL4 [Kalaharituber pfeilii]